jgi:hypothetical protein
MVINMRILTNHPPWPVAVVMKMTAALLPIIKIDTVAYALTNVKQEFFGGVFGACICVSKTASRCYVLPLRVSLGLLYQSRSLGTTRSRIVRRMFLPQS